MIVAFVFAVASQIAVFFLAGDQIVGHGNKPFQDCGVSGAFIGLGGSVHPLTGVLALPAAFPLCNHLRREQLNSVTVGTVDILRQASVISGVYRVAEHTSDHNAENYAKHDRLEYLSSE